MKKKAFTLQEILITMGIVGVVAALSLPAITKMKPDNTKLKYMKVYNALTTVTNDIIEDPSLYYTTYNNGVPSCSGLYCSRKPLNDAYNSNDYEFTSKYPMLVASKLNLQDAPAISWVGQSRKIVFTTTDSTNWEFIVEDLQDNSGNGYYDISLTININPADTSAAHNCVYGETGCTSPNKFNFTIDNNANIRATDFLGQAFLQNPTDMKCKDKDFAKAEDLKKLQTTLQSSTIPAVSD